MKTEEFVDDLDRENWLPIKRVARMMKVTEPTVRNWCKRGVMSQATHRHCKLRFRYFGTRIFIHEVDLRVFMRDVNGDDEHPS